MPGERQSLRRFRDRHGRTMFYKHPNGWRSKREERDWDARGYGKTHCKRGHLLSGDNLLRRKDGSRLCIACERRRDAQRRRKRKEANRD